MTSKQLCVSYLSVSGVITSKHLSVSLPVCERGDDEAVCAAQVLVAVDKLDVGDLDYATVHVLLEVEARLLLPLKVQGGSDVHAHLTEKAEV